MYHQYRFQNNQNLNCIIGLLPCATAKLTVIQLSVYIIDSRMFYQNYTRLG